MIGKNWLQKFDVQYNDTFFLCKVSNIRGLDISDLPSFYQKAINSWVVLRSRIEITDKTSIMNSNLFGNDNICVRNTHFFYHNFSRGTSRQRSGKGAIRKRFPLQKPRWEKTKLTIRYLYHENIS